MTAPGTPAAASEGGLSEPVRAALWMLASALFFAGMAAFARFASHEVHPFEVAFFRSFFGFLVMVPWLAQAGISALKTQRFPLYAVRGVVGAAAHIAFFYAIAHLPLAEATALFFASTLFATMLAFLILRERVDLVRWSAAVVGFLGVLVILRPGFIEPSTAALLALASAAGFGCNLTIVKLLSRTESPNAIVTWMGLVFMPFTLVPALFVWTWPGPWTWAALAAMAACGTMGHQCMTRAFRISDSSLVLPFTYAQLPFAALIGFLAYSEVPAIFTWIGGGIIAGASFYITRREALARRARQKAAAGG